MNNRGTEDMSKLPAPKALYGIIKITAATLDETGGELLSVTVDVG